MLDIDSGTPTALVTELRTAEISLDRHRLHCDGATIRAFDWADAITNDSPQLG
jgi:hypothetical protein